MTDRDRWQTPEPILEFARDLLGGIDLDPATEPGNPTRALRFFTEETDGLRSSWAYGSCEGFMPYADAVWLNPPFSKLLPFANKFVAEAEYGIFLGSYSIEAAWARLLHTNGCRLLVPHSRIRFKAPPGIPDPKTPFPTTLWYLGYAEADEIADLWDIHVGTGLEIYE